MNKQSIIVGLCAALFSLTVSAQIEERNLENALVSSYLQTVYTPDSASVVMSFYNRADGQADTPNPARIYVGNPDSEGVVMELSRYADFSEVQTVDVSKGLATVWNLVPQTIYYYRVVEGDMVVNEGELHTLGQLRMIKLGSTRNVRDMGGWPLENGRRVAYGKIIRGQEIDGNEAQVAADVAELKRLGVGAELDLRAQRDSLGGVSVFGFTAEDSTYLYTDDSGMLPNQMTYTKWLTRWKDEFNFIVTNLRAGRTIYQHCVSGADRTGYLAMLLEGVIGVEYSDLVKDYELTTFSGRERVKETIDPAIKVIQGMAGETLQAKFKTFFLTKIKVNADDLNYFIDEMSEEDIQLPTAIHTVKVATAPARFTLSGTPAGAHSKGIVIERMSDGNIKKMVR